MKYLLIFLIGFGVQNCEAFFNKDGKICYYKWKATINGIDQFFETDNEKDNFVNTVKIASNTITIKNISPSSNDIVTSTVCANVFDFISVLNGDKSETLKVIKKECAELRQMLDLSENGIDQTQEISEQRNKISWLISVYLKKP